MKDINKINVFLIILSCNICRILASQDKTNIILILADDAGYNDFEFADFSLMETPNLKKMAKKGVRFMDMHTSASVSGPSRCGLMTGRYQQRMGVETNNSADIGVPIDEVMISSVLKQAGYKTAAFGKWHLGEENDYHPNKRGFDEFYGFLGGHRNYFYSEKDIRHKGMAVQHNGKYVKFNGYLTDVLGQKAVDFIESNKNYPFFIYLSFNAVHSPFEATLEDLERFKGHPRQKIAAMTWSLDRAIGMVLDKLEEEDLDKNTLVVFLSDNGGDPTKSNFPLKSNKGLEFEGGHRVPCLMQWSGVIPADTIFRGLSSSLDFFPTFVSLSGFDGQLEKRLDGVNLLPYLIEKKTGNPHDWLFWRIERWRGVRYNNYKYVYAQGVGDALYDLSIDMGETKDIKLKNKKLYEEIKLNLDKWESELIAPLRKGDDSWKEVKAYMYKELFENRTPMISDPSGLLKIKK